MDRTEWADGHSGLAGAVDVKDIRKQADKRADWAGPLGVAHRRALAYLQSLADRPVRAAATLADLRSALGGPVPDATGDPAAVVTALADAADPGIVASGGGRYFGFVIGGAHPASMAADWLTSAWDQNAGLFAISPAAAVVEEVAGAWLADLLGLPSGVSFAFVTGAQQANVTGLAAARHEVLRRVGWDVEQQGLIGAPGIRVLAGAARHATIDRALRFLGLGLACIEPVDSDDQGRMDAEDLRRRFLADGAGPTIVCAQAGNVNSGSIDPLAEICSAAKAAGAWVHVDGAFGLWAGASSRLRPLVAGVELADSWATDAHKWLNVPYDCGVVFCAHPAPHRAAMGVRAAYLVHATGDERDPLEFGPEFSRRARAFPVWAAIRSLGRQGIEELVDRCCAHARRFADQLGAADGVEILNDVVLNQVLVRFTAVDGGHPDLTTEVIRLVQQDGTCWLGGTVWQGASAMRISVSNWSTTQADVDLSVDAILRCAEVARSSGNG